MHGLVGEHIMSRIGKQPVIYPAGVKVQLINGSLRVEGPKGKLELAYHPRMNVQHDESGKAIRVTRPDDERLNRASWLDPEPDRQHGGRSHQGI